MSSENEVLRTSLPLLVPVWALAILAGVVSGYSRWSGGTIGLALIYSIYWASCRMRKANEINVKTIEIVLLNLSIPLLSCISSREHPVFPLDTTASNFVLLASVATHSQLLYYAREKITRICMSLMLSACLVATVLTFANREIIPLVTMALYTLLLVWFWIFKVPKQLPLRFLWISVIVLTVICKIIELMDRWRPHRSSLLRDEDFIVIGVAALIASFLGLWEYLLHKKPANSLEVNCAMYSSLHVILMIIPAIIMIICGESDYSWIVVRILYAYCLVALFAVFCYFKQRRSAQKAPVNAPTKAKNVDTFVLIGAVVTLEILLLAYNYVSTVRFESEREKHRTDYSYRDKCSAIPVPFLYIASGLVLIALTSLLDRMRAFLARYNYKLLCATIGLALYTLATAFYVEYHGSLANETVTKTTEYYYAYNSFGKRRDAVVGALWIAAACFVNMAVYFGCAIAEQKKNWTKLPIAANIAGIANKTFECGKTVDEPDV